MADKSLFTTMSGVSISDFVFQKQNLSYLPWSRAIEQVKLKFPDMTFEFCTRKIQRPYSVLKAETKDGKEYETVWQEEESYLFVENNTAFVKTRVVVPSANIDECFVLPIMDLRNKSIPVENITTFEINKSLMRCLTKNIAAATGLGLALWHKDIDSETAKEQAILTGLEQNNAIDKFKAYIKDGYDKEMLVSWLKANFKTTNPQTIKSDEVLARLNAELDNLKKDDFTKKKEK